MKTAKFSIRDIFVEAIMEGKAIVIVEAWEDRQIYSKLADKFGIKNVLFYPPSYFEEGKNDDCNNVIDLVHLIIQNKAYPQSPDAVLGIIDRDYRPYNEPNPAKPEYDWTEVIKIPSLFILKHYSIETYFATSYNLQETICATTKAIPNDIPMNELVSLIKDKQQVLYYLGLSALKMHLGGKKSDGYSKYTVEYLEHFKKHRLSNEEKELNDLAALNLVSENDIQKIVIGKGYLHYWVAETRNWLANKAKSEPIFGFRTPQTNISLYETMKNFFDSGEFEDAINALSQLKVVQK